MNRTCKVAALFIAYLCFVGFVAAADTIWTPNTVTTNGHYYELGILAVNNTDPLVGDTISFTGTLVYDTQGIENKRVDIYNSTDGETWNLCTHGQTDGTGHYNIAYVYPNVTVPVHWKGGFTP